MATADGMGTGRCMMTPPRPSWDLAMGLGMTKPKAVAECLIAGYRDWTVKGFKGKGPRFTTIDPDMEKIDQLIQGDQAGRFEELVDRVSSISKEKLEASLVAWTEHDKLIHYRKIRTAAIVADMKHQRVEVTELNAVQLAAILCAAVPTDPAFLVPYNDCFAYEEGVEVSRHALSVDCGVEPAAQPCGGMWVGDNKSWPEWKAVHEQTALVKSVADQAEVMYGSHPLYQGDDFSEADHHWQAIRAWLTSGRRLSSVQSVQKFVTADRPGMRGYLHAMGKMSGLISSLGDAIEWERYQVLRISPKNSASTVDVEIGPDDGWAFFDLAINFRGQTDTEKVLVHGTTQSSLWGILGCRLLRPLRVTSTWACGHPLGRLRLWGTALYRILAKTRGQGSEFVSRSPTRTTTCSETRPLCGGSREVLNGCSRMRGCHFVESASSSSGLRRTLISWSCATQGAIATCNISIRTSNGIRTLPPLYGPCTSSSPRTTWDR